MTHRILIAVAASLMILTPAAAAGEASAERTMAGIADPYQTAAFDPDADHLAAIDAALAEAGRSGKRVLLVMGTNKCRDSAWFANLITTDRFAPVRARYTIVFADIGMPQFAGMGRNPEVARRFGFKIKGTPTVAVLDAKGHVLNRERAPKWRNAKSRSDDETYEELMR